jgi:hypothetical protein
LEILVPFARTGAHPVAGSRGGPTITYNARRHLPHSAGRRSARTRLPCAYRPRPPRTCREPEDWETERQRVAEYLCQYPSLAGWAFVQPQGSSVGVRFAGPDAAVVPLRLPSLRGSGPEAGEIEVRTRGGYGGGRYASPVIGGSDRPAHPFLLWWGITYGLSMLARYEPRLWANVVTVSSSADASPVEYLLEQPHHSARAHSSRPRRRVRGLHRCAQAGVQG